MYVYIYVYSNISSYIILYIYNNIILNKILIF